MADIAFRDDVIDHREHAVRLEHAMHFAKKLRDRVEVMRRDPACHQIEAFVLERQRLGLGISGAQVGKAAFGGFAFHHVEHFLGDIGRPDALDMRCEGVGDVAAAGGDVQCAPVLLRFGEIDEALQALAQRVRRGGEVARGGLAEMFLDEGLVHEGFRRG